MLPLFTSFFCPRECDRPPAIRSDGTTIEYAGRRFRFQRIHYGDKVPEWARYGWWIFGHETSCPLDELQGLLQKMAFAPSLCWDARIKFNQGVNPDEDTTCLIFDEGRPL